MIDIEQARFDQQYATHVDARTLQNVPRKRSWHATPSSLIHWHCVAWVATSIAAKGAASHERCFPVRSHDSCGGMSCHRTIRRSWTRGFGFLRSHAKRLLMLLQWVLKVMIEAETAPSRRPFLCPHCHVPIAVVGMRQRSAVVT